MTKERRTFSSEFKLQMVRLYKNGKLKNEIIRKYDLKPSIISNSIKQHQNTGPFNHQDNLKSDEKELIKLRKEVQHLKMEHDMSLIHIRRCRRIKKRKVRCASNPQQTKSHKTPHPSPHNYYHQ
ncbi:transposase, partial [Staphylococcus aureus]|nr:transposase [Staphylococcus aureus]